MKLKEALARVVKICSLKKDQDIYREVLFHSKDGLHYVFAFDGTTMKAVFLDEPVPNALVDVDILKVAVKDKGDLTIRDAGYGNIEITSAAAQYRLVGKAFNRAIKFPELPALTPVPDFRPVLQVKHAASTTDVELGVIHFTKEWVEATDQSRLARANTLPFAWEGLVPLAGLKHWPKGPVETLFTKHHAYFKIGDEVRVVALRTHSYPNTENVIPKTNEGNMILVNTKALGEIIYPASQVPSESMVSLTFGAELGITACKGELTSIPDFQASLAILHRVDRFAGKVLWVNGKFLKQALKEVGTPNVRIVYGEHKVMPLQIESGSYTSILWPYL